GRNRGASSRRDVAVGMDRGRQEVTVAAPRAPERRADLVQGVVLVTVAEQQLSRAERAGCEDHEASRDLSRVALTSLESVVVHRIGAISGLNLADKVERTHLCAEVLGSREVV